MRQDSLLWTTKWNTSLEPYTRICPTYNVAGWGSDDEPNSSLWMASLSEAAGKYFCEGIKVLDYGCGGGRYCNFLSGWIKDFSYYGLEIGPEFCTSRRVNWQTKDGANFSLFCKQTFDQHFSKDPRVFFGYIGSTLQTEAINSCNLVILGSVFTHLTIEAIYGILDKMRPIIQNGGRVVFSAFVGDIYLPYLEGDFGIEGYHSTSCITHKQLETYTQQHNYELTISENFCNHSIYRIDKR